jgi:hypothetical protein
MSGVKDACWFQVGVSHRRTSASAAPRRMLPGARFCAAFPRLPNSSLCRVRPRCLESIMPLSVRYGPCRPRENLSSEWLDPAGTDNHTLTLSITRSPTRVSRNCGLERNSRNGEESTSTYMQLGNSCPSPLGRHNHGFDSQQIRRTTSIYRSHDLDDRFTNPLPYLPPNRNSLPCNKKEASRMQPRHSFPRWMSLWPHLGMASPGCPG